MISLHPKSTAAIGGHPIHPMLVNFPITFFTAALATDIAYWRTAATIWAVASTWLLGAGLVMAALAAIAGLPDFLGSRQIRTLKAAWHHMIGNVSAVVLSLVNFVLHLRGGDAAVLPTGLVLSAIVVAILLFTGWLGGEMVFRHGVAVADDADRGQ